jgi:hypothetical protein
MALHWALLNAVFPTTRGPQRGRPASDFREPKCLCSGLASLYLISWPSAERLAQTQKGRVRHVESYQIAWTNFALLDQESFRGIARWLQGHAVGSRSATIPS